MAAFHTAAVIGAGVMGRGIAHAAALAGYRTILEDILPTALRKAGDEIRGALDQGVATRHKPVCRWDFSLRRQLPGCNGMECSRCRTE